MSVLERRVTSRLASSPASSRGRLWDGLSLLALAALPLLFLRIVPGGLPPYGGDILVHVYPLLSVLAHALHAGRPALWNPYAAGGYPLAPYSALALYPPAVLALLALPVGSAIAALYATYDALLGIGMYALAGELGLTRPARLLAAVTMACSGFVAAHTYAGHLFELGAICLMPVAFFLLRRAIRRHQPALAIWCGAAVGLMVLAAGVQFLPFALAPLPALALWHTCTRLRQAAFDRRKILWPFAAVATAGLVAVALSAVLLLPFREILGASLRASAVPFGAATMQSWRWPPWSGVTMLVAPNGLGNAADGNFWLASRFGPYFHEMYAYAGLIPLLLAPVALLRRPDARPYGLLAVAALVLMIGDTPVYRALYALPGGDLLRAPARAGLILEFALALLAAFGLDAIRTIRIDGFAPLSRRLFSLTPGVILIVAVVAGLALASSAGDVIPVASRGLAATGAVRAAIASAIAIAACVVVARDSRLAILLPVLAALDLTTANRVLLRPTQPSGYFTRTAAVNAIPPSDRNARYLAINDAIPPGLGMVTRQLYDVQDFAPLALQEYWQLSHPSIVARVNGGVIATGRDVIRDLDPFFLRLFGVATISSSSTVNLPAARLIATVSSVRWTVPGGASWNLEQQRISSLVYHSSSALPRTFVARQAVLVPDANAAQAVARSRSTQLTNLVVLTPAPAAPSGLVAAVQRAWSSWLEAGSDGMNGVAARVDGGKTGGYAVLDDGWFPGWTATIDGHDTPVLRADYLLKAVRLPPGRHSVHMVYAPLSYLAGAAITLATALALVLLATFQAARRIRRAIVRA